MTVRILKGDCRERMRDLDEASVDSCVTDPPYHLTSIVKRFGKPGSAPVKIKKVDGKGGSPFARSAKGFMGQTWDGGDVAFQPETWAEVLRVLKPGAHLVAFSGTRTYHRMACAIEDAGFEIRDQLAWVYGSGFPKSHDVSKGIDKVAGAAREITPASPMAVGSEVGKISRNIRCDVCGKPRASANPCKCPRDSGPSTDAAREWQGWGTALKPAWEPICLARKPLIGTVAGNVLAHGTGALNIDGCRIGTDGGTKAINHVKKPDGRLERWDEGSRGARNEIAALDAGRWPANIIHDGSEEVLAGFPDSAGQQGDLKAHAAQRPTKTCFGDMGPAADHQARGDSVSAARFFYCAKATSEERGEGNNHPTVKPVDLMRWLCRLVTPKGGTVLDPFAGSGSTLVAADAEQFNAIGCELSPEYAAIAERRARAAAGLFAEVQAA